jgi:hypothetical protein
MQNICEKFLKIFLGNFTKCFVANILRQKKNFNFFLTESRAELARLKFTQISLLES